MERYICIHGHFYQPPRENPWLEAIELQDSAYPYHDWNERINAECYDPNATSRILDGQHRIVKIINNYARISFNMGPTLLAWMEHHAPSTYAAILAADHESRRRFAGHGSAIAQVYNHMIMPLANTRDKRTQVIWGIRDFEYRFGRFPEGMWLAETAVDLETLEILAEHRIRFTILAPSQASRFRKLGETAWSDVGGGRIDPSRAYVVNLPSGRKINLFFYDGPISRAVAFEHLLASGETFAHRLNSGFNGGRNWPQLVHIATDGESYGHHHHYGDMGLSYALDYIERQKLARLTNYAEYLTRHPATHEVQIYEKTAWSCVHGVERWNSNCGCNSGGHPGWNQHWRRPLRAALDWLRDTLAPAYEQLAGTLFSDPWAARDAYIDVILNRTPDTQDSFFRRYAAHPLDPAERVVALKLLELQRHAMLMYTSCGWFFDELSGIETVQVIAYAGRAIQLAEELFGSMIEAPFLQRLAEAKSNLPEHGDGRQIYKKFVVPARVDQERVAAHYAISSLFEAYGRQTRIYCYDVDCEDYQSFSNDEAQLVLGRARFTSEITGESDTFAFGVLQHHDHQLNGGISPPIDPEAYQAMTRELSLAFERGALDLIVESIEQYFGESSYSLKSLFRDERRKIVGVVLEQTMHEAEQLYRQLYDRQAPLMGFLVELDQPLPRPFATAAEFVISADLRRAMEEGQTERVQDLLAEARRWDVAIDAAGLAYTLQQTIERQISLTREQIALGLAPATTLPLLQRTIALAEMTRSLPFETNMRQVQNIFYEMAQTVYPEVQVAADRGDAGAGEWTERFAELGDRLNVRVEAESRVWALKTASRVAEAGQELIARRHVPRTTYRLQFNADFTFADATALVDYLRDLGVSDIYASPILTARTGSSHGYDITDHTRLSAVLGGQEGFEQLATALQERGLGLILDIVPNHMGVGPDNPWWMDVLENGPGSSYAGFFDIDWNPTKPELQNKLLLPVLGDQYGTVLESGQLKLTFEEGAFFIDYYENRLPLAPRSYGTILSHPLDRLVDTLGPNNEQLLELQSILTAISYLPPRTETDSEKLAERNREKEKIKQRLATLYSTSPAIRQAINTTVEIFNGNVGFPHTFDRLDALIADQPYRPSFWQVAGDEINYRRFFDVNELAAIRMEQPEVFAITHKLVLRLLGEGKVTGLRVDHSDGLRDPGAYFRQLQEHYLLVRIMQGDETGRSPEEVAQIVSNWLSAAADANGTTARWPLFVVAEKILAEGEPLPREWAIYGTTGYDFLSVLNGIFVNRQSHKAIYDIYSSFIGDRPSFHNLVNSNKKRIMLISMAAEINALSHQLERISEKNRAYRDFTLPSLTFALREVIAALAIYRTYVGEDRLVSERDTHYVEAATAEAKRRNPRTSPSLFDFIRDTLLLRNLNRFEEDQRDSVIAWVMKFQQITGPVMAKGVEDTTFYVYNPLVSLNEVGDHPQRFGSTLEEFHQHNAERQQGWPYTLLATSTHDTKRSEDTRARINVLSELPERWEAALRCWSELNERHKQRVGGELAPDTNDEYLFYQTLLGIWPFGTLDHAPLVERMVEYMQKAIKEAKVHTSWVTANINYEEAVRDFVQGALADKADNRFLQEFVPLARAVAFFGQFNALAQVLLKLTAPGVPDLYQGTELWDFSLVDPDNRRPVDYALRRQLLAALQANVTAAEKRGSTGLRALAEELLANSHDGRIKLFTTTRLLQFRAEHEDLFAHGEYLPLAAFGTKQEHVCAFARNTDSNAILVVAPRLVVGLTGGVEHPPLGEVWADTTLALPEALPGGRWRNLFTGEELRPTGSAGTATLAFADVFATFPVAVLERV